MVKDMEKDRASFFESNVQQGEVCPFLTITENAG
jgi:hypothetical protein